MMTDEMLNKFNGITHELEKLKCNNPHCDKKETDAAKMYRLTADDTSFLDIKITDNICCDSFEKIITDRYNHLRVHLSTH